MTPEQQALANESLDKLAENERELGIQMQPADADEARYKEVIEGVRKLWDDRRKAKQQPASQRSENTAWVGLTDEEIGDALSMWELTEEWPTFAYAARAIEAKLREKNGGKA